MFGFLSICVQLQGWMRDGRDSGLQDSWVEAGDFRIERASFERSDQNFAGFRGIDDGVDPESGCAVAWIGLRVVVSANLVLDSSFFRFGDRLAFALELFGAD